ncbi:beta-lactamase/transpeptidase-like protein [Mycena capillaripes]|nr:beta-lactamase/transpeptidase-like protein [Mycena capillaripes]
MHFFVETVVASVLLRCSVASAFAHLQQPLVSDDARPKKILTNRVEAAINSILNEFHSPGGVGVAVVHKGQDHQWRVETKGYGIAKVDGSRVTENTLFGIGSNSKLFDILATGLLVSNESLSPRISWNTKIASVVPEWELMDPVASSESTIVDVMSHRTGLPAHDWILRSQNVVDTVRRLRYLKPSAGFRESWQYSNHMYTLLSYLPPVLVGVPFETYVNDFILQPLGMNSTTFFSKNAAESGHLADGMGRDGVNQTEDMFGMGQVRAYPFWVPSNEISGAGGVISNAKDMAIWLQTLLDEGRHPVHGRTVIPEDAIRRVGAGITVSTPVAQFPELSPVVYGGGQRREYIYHGGSVRGFKSYIARIPSQDFGVAVLSNDQAFGYQIVDAIKFRIMDEYLNLEAIDWSARFQSLSIAGLKSRPIPTPRPPKPVFPSLPFSALAGTYRNLGYGILELCFVSSDHLLSPNSASCRKLIREIPATLPSTLDPDVPTLLARWDGYEMTHISLAHFQHNVFNASGFLSIPTGNSSDVPYWVQVLPRPGFMAEFSCEGNVGVGLRGFWGAGENIASPHGESAEARAEAWFEKVDNVDLS